MSKRGYFIVFEGLDGAGTTTQAQILQRHLYNLDKANNIVATREPTMLNPYGCEIRRRLEGKLLPHERVIDDFSYWAKLFVNDRIWHLNYVVKPNVDNGLYVISDRHMLSTLAYQSAQGGQMEQLIKMHQDMYAPDLTIFLKVPVEVALDRIKSNRPDEPMEYFEKKEGFLAQTAANYEKAIELVGKEQNIIEIDGSLPIEEVSKAVFRGVYRLFGYDTNTLS